MVARKPSVILTVKDPKSSIKAQRELVSQLKGDVKLLDVVFKDHMKKLAVKRAELLKAETELSLLTGKKKNVKSKPEAVGD